MFDREKGFALTELIIVAAVLGILCAVAVPAVRSFGPWPLRTATQALAARMREARQTAIASGDICYVAFYELSSRYRLDLPDGQEWVNLPDGVEIGAVNFPLFDGRPTLYFRYTGAPNRGGHVALKDKRGEWLYLIVTPVTGRVRISDTPP
jgi:prepilin-type N-terminal cleavage/methylation domain-containing protein